MYSIEYFGSLKSTSVPSTLVTVNDIIHELLSFYGSYPDLGHFLSKRRHASQPALGSLGATTVRVGVVEIW
jgi:hypothetical protein